jgi:4-carboxymuconolactone decarboxylase
MTAPIANMDGLHPVGGWINAGPPRLTPPPPEQRGLIFRAMSLAARRFGRSQVPDIFSTLHINPRLFWAWLFFASRLMPGGRLPARDREKVILRIGWNTRCRYEWGQHVEVGLRAGLSDEDIVRVSRGPAACVDAHERALLTACDELFRDHVIGAATWHVLAQSLRPKLLIELTMLAGHYVMVAGFLNSSGLVLEPALEAQLRAFHDRIAGAPWRQGQ